jgi:hypothetical protein
VLAGTVVVDRLGRATLLDADLELLLRRGSLGQQPPDGLDLFRLGAMGSRRDRDVCVVQVVARAHERQRLERLGRRAQRRDQLAVARLGDDLAIPYGNGVYEVDRLHERSAPHGYADRVHEARRVFACLSYRRWRRGAARSTSP